MIWFDAFGCVMFAILFGFIIWICIAQPTSGEG